MKIMMQDSLNFSIRGGAGTGSRRKSRDELKGQIYM